MMSNSKMCVSSCAMRPYSRSGGSSIGSSMRSRYGSANAPTPSCAAPGATFCCSNSLCVLNRISGTLNERSCFRSALTCWYALFGVAGDPLEMLLDIGVVVDLEVVGRVDVPVEVVVVDVVLAEVRDERRLRAARPRPARTTANEQRRGDERASSRWRREGTRMRIAEYLEG